MTVKKTEQQLTHEQAKQWIENRGIERLPTKDECLEYMPPGSYNQYYLARKNNEFWLTSYKIQ